MFPSQGGGGAGGDDQVLLIAKPETTGPSSQLHKRNNGPPSLSLGEALLLLKSKSDTDALEALLYHFERDGSNVASAVLSAAGLETMVVLLEEPRALPYCVKGKRTHVNVGSVFVLTNQKKKLAKQKQWFRCLVDATMGMWSCVLEN